MADFCKQCSIETFCEDFEDLANLCAPGHVTQALCEGCGHCFVNHTGECVTKNCHCKHGSPETGWTLIFPQQGDSDGKE